jgi:hypothetical protein
VLELPFVGEVAPEPVRLHLDQVGLFAATARRQSVAPFDPASSSVKGILFCVVYNYPLGRVAGRQALAVRTTDATIHTWDLAQALGVDDRLGPAWSHRSTTVSMPSTPVCRKHPSPPGRRIGSSALPAGTIADDASQQDRLWLSGRPKIPA